MKIGELSKRSGLSTYTIRYYERIGLLPYADRDAGGWRDYDISILDWIAFLERLKTTGMPISDMLRYTRLRADGDHTFPDRRMMLEKHRDRVRDKIAALQDCLHVLNTKIDGYAEHEKGTQNEERKTNHRNTT